MELTHIDLNQCVVLAKQEFCKCLGQFGLTHTGRTSKDEGTGGASRILQAGTGAANRTGDGLHGIVLADDALVQFLLHVQQA